MRVSLSVLHHSFTTDSPLFLQYFTPLLDLTKVTTIGSFHPACQHFPRFFTTFDPLFIYSICNDGSSFFPEVWFMVVSD